MLWGMATTAATCPNCGATGYKEKDPCDSCGFLKPTPKKLSEGYLIFCNDCGCHYVSEVKACPLHGFDSVKLVKT